MRRHRAGVPHHENHERWLISYADFITLLFALFVILFANSQMDQAKIQQVSDSVKVAMGATVSARSSNAGALASKKEVVPEEVEFSSADLQQLQKSFEKLTTDFKGEIAEGKLEVKLTLQGLVISMREAAFFRPGDAAVQPVSYPMVQKLAQVMTDLPNAVRLEGHTDSNPIANSRFRSNWELSAARSIAMMELLTGKFEIARERVSIAGFADVQPVAPNDSEVNRARNRRVDVVILSQ